ncbi:MAG TPA: BadF/BadG/BcrA/BcrD ATPase family protein [Lacunisphaera sp.]|nr:BadF/BadG/BcrA/BcrD ATPase family protein [Lacunisphaera sp.]
MTDFTTPLLKIGVDGGGTKTELILVDAAGAIVARHAVAGCNPSQVGPEKAREILLAGLKELLALSPLASRPSPVTATHLYMAGATAFWQELAATLDGFGRVVAAADSLPVLELATGGAPGLVLHAGTGSFVAARAPDGSVHYAGGLGWKLGDAGSGFDLGRRGIALAMLELQGWAPPSDLGAKLKAHTGLADAAANSRYFYTDPAANARITAFAPLVIDLAAHGCAPAQVAVTETLTELVGQARLVTAKLFPAMTVPCGVSGAILNRAPAVSAIQALAANPPWPVTLNFITAAPIEGVRRLLAKAKPAT